MRQYRSLTTWQKVRDELSDLHGEEFLSAISEFDGLGPPELEELGIDHAGIVDDLDRSLRALDGKGGRTPKGGPEPGERGITLSGYRFVTSRRRIRRVALRMRPEGELFEFGQEWLPDVAGYVRATLFKPESVPLPNHVGSRLTPDELAVITRLQVVARAPVAVQIGDTGIDVSVQNRQMPLYPHAMAFTESRSQPVRVDVVDRRTAVRRTYSLQGNDEVTYYAYDEESLPKIHRSLRQKFESLIDDAAAGSAAVVGVEVDLRRSGMYRLVWPDWTHWEPNLGWASHFDGVYFTDQSFDVLRDDARKGHLPRSIGKTPRLIDPDFMGVEDPSWDEIHHLPDRSQRSPARFVLVGGHIDIVGLQGDISIDTTRHSEPPGLIAAATASSTLTGQTLVSLGEALLGQGYGIVCSEWAHQATAATENVMRRLPRSLGGAGSSFRPPPDKRSWWYLTKFHDIPVGGSASPQVIVWLSSVAMAHRLARLINLASQFGDELVTVVMLHTPETERFARSYNSLDHGEYEPRLSSVAELKATSEWCGTVVRTELRPTLVLDRDEEVDAGMVAGALDYLNNHSGSELSPWQVITHPLLRTRTQRSIPSFRSELAAQELETTRVRYQHLTRYLPTELWQQLFTPLPPSPEPRRSESSTSMRLLFGETYGS